jgi:hypothetical protein
VSRNGAAWQAKLNARADDNLSEKQRVARGTLAGQVLKHNHDKLEASVVELAWILYRIQLYKTDAGAVAFKCECGKNRGPQTEGQNRPAGSDRLHRTHRPHGHRRNQNR